MSNYVILYGNSSNANHLQSVTRISNGPARQQWYKLLHSNPSVVRKNENVVIMNSRAASISFKFMVPAGRYDIFVRCIAPSIVSNTGTVRMDGFRPQLWDISRRPLQYVYRQVSVLLFSNRILNKGVHTITFGFKEPIGLISMVVKKRQSSLQSASLAIPAFDALYDRNKVYTETTPTIIVNETITTTSPPSLTTDPPVIDAVLTPIDSVPIVEYSTTPLPIVQIEERPLEEIITPLPPPIVEYSTTPIPIMQIEERPLEEINTPLPSLIEEVSTPLPSPMESIATTTIAPVILPTTTAPVQSPVITQKKKRRREVKKGLPMWLTILLGVFALGVLVYLVYIFWFKEKPSRHQKPHTPKNQQQRRLQVRVQKALQQAQKPQKPRVRTKQQVQEVREATIGVSPQQKQKWEKAFQFLATRVNNTNAKNMKSIYRELASFFHPDRYKGTKQTKTINDINAKLNRKKQQIYQVLRTTTNVQQQQKPPSQKPSSSPSPAASVFTTSPKASVSAPTPSPKKSVSVKAPSPKKSASVKAITAPIPSPKKSVSAKAPSPSKSAKGSRKGPEEKFVQELKRKIASKFPVPIGA